MAPHVLAQARKPLTTESDLPSEFASGWKEITQTELDEVIRLHQMFRQGRTGGKRANLSFYNLSHRDLSHKDLSDADFSGCRMQNASVRGTKLAAANLFAADLRASDLTAAILNRADL